MIGHFHQTLIFTFLLVLQGSLAYVQPIHIRYSDEQLKELEDNPRPPNRFDQPRTLIDNPYGAQIYYEEILPEDEEILAARNTELQNESFRRGPFENQESFRRGPFENHENIPNHHFNSPDGIQNFWNHQNHMNPNFYRIHMQTVSPNGFNNNYYLNYYDQQYSEYLRELLYSFYFQKQVLSELINQQEQQLQILRAQFDQLNGAITNTEHQIQQIHSPPSSSSSPVSPSPSPVPPNQQKPSSTTATTTQSQLLTTSVPTQQQKQQQEFTYQSGQSGSEIKPSSEIGIEKETETETEQIPKEELNTNTEDNLENNNEQTNNNNNDDNNNVII